MLLELRTERVEINQCVGCSKFGTNAPENFDFTQARKYVKPRPDPKELCFATDDDEPLSPIKRTRLSF